MKQNLCNMKKINPDSIRLLDIQTAIREIKEFYKSGLEDRKTVMAIAYSIAIIGEAPGETEHKLKQPFSGPSGNFLNALLGKVGILRNACFVGNVSQCVLLLYVRTE